VILSAYLLLGGTRHGGSRGSIGLSKSGDLPALPKKGGKEGRKGEKDFSTIKSSDYIKEKVLAIATFSRLKDRSRQPQGKTMRVHTTL